MKLKEAIAKLEKDKTYKAWRNEHKEYFLAHCFVMLDELNKHIWQIGYFSDKKQRMTTFVIEPERVRVSEDAEVFKEPGTTINGLDMQKVKIDIDKVVEIADKVQQEHYSKEDPMKAIIILQSIKDCGQVFNVTFTTRGTKVLNIKIDSTDGKVISHQIMDLFSFDK